MFAKLKQSFADKLQSFSSSGDAELQRLQAKCEECTSEYLLNEDWGSIMDMCSMIVEGDARTGSERVLRTLCRRLEVRNPRVQMLALTVASACVQNCGPLFHQQLAISSFWVEMKKLVSPSRMDSKYPTDVEVRERILALTEDWARALPYQTFADEMDTLLQQGVIFPTRPEHSKLPHYNAEEYAQAQNQQQAQQERRLQRRQSASHRVSQPDTDSVPLRQQYQPIPSSSDPQPVVPTTYHDAGVPGSGAYGNERRSQRTSQATVVEQVAMANAEVDPSVLEGMSEADRAAVMAALHDAGGSQQAAPPAPAPRTTEQAPTFASSAPDALKEDLAGAAATIELLKDLLHNLPSGTQPSSDTLAAELASRCSQMQPALADIIPRVSDEALMGEALHVHDELTKVMEQYEHPTPTSTAPAHPQVAVEAPKPDPNVATTSATTSANFQGDYAPSPSLAGTSAGPAPKAAPQPDDLIDFGADSPPHATTDGPVQVKPDPFAASSELPVSGFPSHPSTSQPTASSLPPAGQAAAHDFNVLVGGVDPAASNGVASASHSSVASASAAGTSAAPLDAQLASEFDSLVLQGSEGAMHAPSQ